MVNPSRWLLTPTRRERAKMRLYFFHHAGGSAGAYLPWATDVADTIQVSLVELPGRGHRFHEADDLGFGAVAEICADAIRDDARDSCFALMGHSMGGLLALEVAGRLEPEARSGRLRHLVVSGASSPSSPQLVDRWDDLSRGALERQLRDLDGTPPEILDSPEMLEIAIGILARDYRRLWEAHQNDQLRRNRLDIPLTVFGGRTDPCVPASGLKAWAAHTSRSFELVVISGGHFFIHQNRAEICQIVGERLLNSPK